MSERQYALSETPIGWCALIWRAGALAGVAWPQDSRAAAAACAEKRFGAALSPAPDWVAELADRVRDLLAGGKPDFGDAPLDFSPVPAFDREVLELTRAISPGETRTYGELARALGDVSLSRRVGQALGRNPFPIIVPCHRVVGAGGVMTGFSAPGGTDSKRRILKIEGALEPDLFD